VIDRDDAPPTDSPTGSTGADEIVPEEVSFDEHLFPARPARLRPRARLRDRLWQRKAKQPGSPTGDNADYINWLVSESMLADAEIFTRNFSGMGSMWQNPYAAPDPRAAIDKAAVWFTAYPISMITKENSTFLATLGDPDLWNAFQQIGISAIHTGPVKRAGGITGWELTPSVDGHFDRISTQFDDVFGTEDEFRAMCEVATAHGGTVIDDIVPGHTGKGADFRLAEMKVGDYPGIYHMVEIPKEDWDLLPEGPTWRDSATSTWRPRRRSPTPATSSARCSASSSSSPA
jgi:trehalose synthase